MTKTEKLRAVDRPWFEKRMDEKSLSLRALAKLSGFNPSNLSRVLRGMQPIRIEQAILISQALDAPLELVLGKAGVPVPVRSIQVVGVVDDALNVIRNIQRPAIPPLAAFPDLPLNAVGVVCTDTTSPAWGWHFCFVPANGVSPDAVGRLCVVTLADGQEMIRFVRPSLRIGFYDLLPLFNKRPYTAVELVSATPVLHIRP